MELSIDTSTRFASVGLSSRGQLFASATWRSQQNHSVELVPAILALMERHDVRRSQLEAIFVAVGPGGFSALRVGMSTAKAMAVALRIPVAPVGTLDVEAHPYLCWGTQVCALIEAGRRRVYQGRYPAGGELGPQYSVVDLDSLGTDVEDTTLYCGEAAKGLSGLLQERAGPRAVTVDAPAPTRSPSLLAELGWDKLESGGAADSESMQPIYLRSAQVSAANRTWAPG